jgi:F-type H+-transporting ATPase subunit b
MFAFLFSFVILLSESAHSAGTGNSGGWLAAFNHFWETYFNNPGFPLWKFINLAIFAGGLGYLLKKPLTESFKAKRELIRAELIKAEEDKKAAMAKLTEIESKTAQLESEKDRIILTSQIEADNERRRIAEQTESDIAKIRGQAEAEIARTKNVAQNQLRKFSAEESIRLAEQILREKLGASSDADLVRVGINNLGGAK